MTLTKKNMKSEENQTMFGNHVADIKNMNYNQLEKYIKLVFSGKKDYTFLPQSFWHNSSFSLYGDDSGRAPPQPGNFFGYIHDISKKVELKDNIESILEKIMTNCLNKEEKLSKEDEMLAYFSVQSVEYVWFREGGIGDELKKCLLKKEKPFNIEEAREKTIKARENSKETKKIFELADKIQNDRKYSHLDFRYSTFSLF